MLSQGPSVLAPCATRPSRDPHPLHLTPIFPPASGDGHADAPPVPPGELVVTAVVLASGVDPGPSLPLVLSHVAAGFPSPADDYVEDHLDLVELVGATSPSCFFMRVAGESMTGDGIYHGDVIVVDRAAEPVNGSVVVASVDGELTVKRFMRRGSGARPRVALLAANPAYPAIELSGEQELVVWGVVTHSLRDHRPRGPRGSA